MVSHSSCTKALYRSSALCALNSSIEKSTWLAQRRFILRRIQSCNVPCNSNPVLNTRIGLKPSSSVSFCNQGDSRLLQVIMMRPVRENKFKIYKLPTKVWNNILVNKNYSLFCKNLNNKIYPDVYYRSYACDYCGRKHCCAFFSALYLWSIE